MGYLYARDERPQADDRVNHLEQTAEASAPPTRGLESPIEQVIRPAKRRLRVSDLVRHWAVIRVIAARDFKVKYKQSLLGPLWLVFQPLALLVGFIIAFRNLGNVQTAGAPYVVFALVGLSAWSFFQAAMTIATSSLITNASYIRYTPCPRLAFPVAAIIASLPAFVVTIVGALVAAAASGDLSPRAALLPFGLVWLLISTMGIVGITSSLAVRYRDIIGALPFVLQIGVFLAPIGYSLADLSGASLTLVELNPLTGIIEAWRWMVIAGYDPPAGPIPLSLAMTIALGVAGWWLFSRLETTMADEI
jgi:ABC-type polysaccharide/polyol phosphate export permease